MKKVLTNGKSNAILTKHFGAAHFSKATAKNKFDKNLKKVVDKSK